MPATANPLVASYALTVPRDASVRVELGLNTTYAQRTWAQPTPAGGGQVVILVAGMRGSTAYHLRAVADFPDGSEYVGPDQTFTTGDISGLRFPSISVCPPSASCTGQPQSGVESPEAVPNGTSDASNRIFITDLEGNVIWFYPVSADDFSFPTKLLSSGHFLVNVATKPGLNATVALREIDLAGNTIREMDIPTLNSLLANAGFTLTVNSISHDFAPLPNGHTILLTNLYQTVNRSTGPVSILGDALIDLDQNWNPVWAWNSFDHLDVNRTVLDPIDWTHGNAVVYTPDDGNLIYSMRNQSWVIKIDYENGSGTGGILWTSGYDPEAENNPLTLIPLAGGSSPADWHYGQHYPWVVSAASAGTFQMGVYDDGNSRVLNSSGAVCGTTNEPACYSRAVIYSIDESKLTATELWEYNASPIFTPFLGSIQALANGDVEFDQGAISTPPPRAKILEVTPASAPRTVWEMDVADHYVYRGLRLPSLYPAVQW